MHKYQLLLAPGPSPTPSEFAWAKAAGLPHLGYAGAYGLVVVVVVVVVIFGLKRIFG